MADQNIIKYSNPSHWYEFQTAFCDEAEARSLLQYVDPTDNVVQQPWPLPPLAPAGMSTTAAPLAQGGPSTNTRRNADRALPTATEDPTPRDRDLERFFRDDCRQFELVTQRKVELKTWVKEHVDVNLHSTFFLDSRDLKDWIREIKTHAKDGIRTARNMASQNYREALKSPKSLRNISNWTIQWERTRRVAAFFGVGEAKENYSWINDVELAIGHLLPHTINMLRATKGDDNIIQPRDVSNALINDSATAIRIQQSGSRSHARGFVAFNGEHEPEDRRDDENDSDGNDSPDTSRRSKRKASDEGSRPAKWRKVEKEENGDTCLICNKAGHTTAACYGVSSNRMASGRMVSQKKLNFIEEKCKGDSRIRKIVEEARKSS